MFPAWFSDLSRWWRRRRSRTAEHLHFVLFTRPGCHLCEYAKQQIEAVRRRYRFTLKEVNVDNDPELVRQYGSLVPVITVNGKVRFRGGINPVLLDRLLQAEEEKATRSKGP